MKILIVEDDKTNSQLLVKVLEKFGCVDAVNDGEKAIKAYLEAIDKKEPYDLVCLDIMMPVIDGFTILGLIRDVEEKKKTNIGKGPRVFVISALSDAETIAKCYELGCHAFITKPINIKEIRNQLNSC